jgi:hypothetical protein
VVVPARAPKEKGGEPRESKQVRILIEVTFRAIARLDRKSGTVFTAREPPGSKPSHG